MTPSTQNDLNGEHGILIGGHRKSGTTLLVSLLDSHPELCTYPGDSGFFYYSHPYSEMNNHDGSQCIEQVIKTCIETALATQLKSLGPGNADLINIHDMIHSFRNMLSPNDALQPWKRLIALNKAFAHANISKQTYFKSWIHKSTYTEMYADMLFDWQPNFHLIHVVRDPRDNYAAIKAGWQKHYSRFTESVNMLLQSVLDRCLLSHRLALIGPELYGSNRYLVIRHEDLTNSPKQILEKICDFIGISFHKCLLQPTILGYPWKGNNHDKIEFNGISTINNGRWQERIDEEEACILEFYFKDTMDKLGYDRIFSSLHTAKAASKFYIWQESRNTSGKSPTQNIT